MRSPDTIRVAVTRADHPLALLHIVATEFHPDAPSRGEAPELTAEQVKQFARSHRLVTDDVVEREIDQLQFADVVRWRFIDHSDVPADRTYRDALIDQANIIMPEMATARDLQRAHLRERRAPLLARLDVDQLRAIVHQDEATVSEIEARKQALRDLPQDPAIDAATTLAELKAAGMDVLE